MERNEYKKRKKLQQQLRKNQRRYRRNQGNLRTSLAAPGVQKASARKRPLNGSIGIHRQARFWTRSRNRIWPRRVGKTSGSSTDERLTKTAEETLNAKDTMAEEHVTGGKNSPPGFSDESIIDEQTGTTIRRNKRATKNQEPKRFGSPVKHSVKEVGTNEDIADLNELALERYRQKLANLKTDTSRPLETRLGLLECHLFRRKFGYSALDTSRPWNAKWKVPLNLTQ